PRGSRHRRGHRGPEVPRLPGRGDLRPGRHRGGPLLLQQAPRRPGSAGRLNLQRPGPDPATTADGGKASGRSFGMRGGVGGREGAALERRESTGMSPPGGTHARFGSLALGLSAALLAAFPLVRPFFPLDPLAPAETMAAASPVITSAPWVASHLLCTLAFV